MRITLDATPLLGRQTGVGRYVQHLVAELPAAVARRGLDVDLGVSTWTARGGAVEGLPAEVRQRGRRVPARVVRSLWRHGDHPTIELLVGATDVFHGTNFVSPPTRRAREVVTVHDLTYVHHAETVSEASLAYRELVPRALARGAHVVTPSRAVADAVRELYGLDEHRVTPTPLGVEEAWFAATPAEPTWLAAHDLPSEYLVFVGSLDPRKNLPTLLAAYRALRSTHPDVPPLVLAGPAGRETALAEQPGVHIAGWLDDAELVRLVAGSAALALPSLDEGFGLPVAEALACGRPVVVSQAPALLEVAGPHAFAAPAADPDALADALWQALRSPDDESARAARRAHARTFTWAATADRTLDVYLGR